MSEIPAEIMESIRERASEEWPGDDDMQEHMIGEEMAGYIEFYTADYGSAFAVKDDIIKEAMEFNETWEDRARHVRDEIEAFAALEALPPDDVPAEFVAKAKEKAASEHDWYWSQLEQVEREIDNYRQIMRTRAKVTPIRELLQRMEKIIGANCYNDNIQNRAYGYLESTGRQFRYPVTFYTSDVTEEKRRERFDDLAPEVLITGHYKVGANELNIYRALVQIVDMLQADYGLQLGAPPTDREG